MFLIDVNAERADDVGRPGQPDEIINGAEVDVVEKVLELTGGRGADVIITATAANVTQEQAISMAARNGRISFSGANGSAPEHNKRALEAFQIVQNGEAIKVTIEP